MPEPDKTRWIGIRPTNPPENIPVTESAPLTEIEVEPVPGCDPFPVTESDPLTDILVAPSAGNPQFQTRTRKFAPAISDLQAIKLLYREDHYHASRNCTVAYTLLFTQVTAGELWVITKMAMENITTMCDLHMQAHIGIDTYPLKTVYSVEPDIVVVWDGMIVLQEDDRVYAKFALGGATDGIKGYALGYKIGVY